MNDITTLPAERDNLSLHVDLCSQRYLLLEKRLAVLEAKFDRLASEIDHARKSMGTTIITSAATVTAGIIGLITTIVMKF